MSTFDWKKNKEVGLHLMEYSNEEEYQLSTINRFYYSCFGPLKDYYEKSYRKILPSRNSHQTLIGELQTSPFL